MDPSMMLEYGWVLIVLVVLEGILAADNAVVMAVMVKHLPEDQQRKALFYGLVGAFVFRFLALFIITYLVNVWWIQAIGAAYLIFLSVHHIYVKQKTKNSSGENDEKRKKEKKGSSFWVTVLKIEVADIAFAIDSMLAAVALAVTLKPTGWFHIGGIDGGQFIVMFLGGLFGVILMRFAATSFVKLLVKFPTLETAAYLIVGWVGIKLTIYTLAHPKVAVINEHFPESTLWTATFWIVLIGIGVGGYLVSKRQSIKTT